MDFAKAFDNVKHTQWQIKGPYNLNPYITNWYLRNRKQRLVFKGSSYLWYNVYKGTIQGTLVALISIL